MNEDLLMSLPVDCSTRDVAQVLGMAVRSVQLMVDRGELEAWKTPGGHRRIARASVERWLKQRNGPVADAAPAEPAAALPVDRAAATQAGSAERGPVRRPRVLLIEDSAHFQNLVQLLVAHGFPQVDLHVAEDGIVGLAMAGELQPDVLIVDILLPGIDGATLIARLRSHPQFQRSRLIVVTSLDLAQRAPYAFALEGLPVVHKPHLVQELPVLLARYLGAVD
jgi:excisionase family DNA binding protein